MKNARQVCSCKSIGQLQFDGMGGSIVVGMSFVWIFVFSVADFLFPVLCNVNITTYT